MRCTNRVKSTGRYIKPGNKKSHRKKPNQKTTQSICLVNPKTQFPGDGDKPTCDVVIGFDFGTSCSKVIIRTPYHHGGRACAVPFDEAAHKSSKYFLPSVLKRSENGQLTFSNGNSGCLYRDIKFHLMKSEFVRPLNEKHDSLDAKILTAAFLALGLRQARDWFLRTQQKLYGKYKLVWHLNIGLPSANYADKKLTDAYKTISRAAWRLSLVKEQVTIVDTKAIYNTMNRYKPLATDRIEVDVIPEVAAEVVGYARSQQRDEGLHLLVDVGASTLDVCSFLLRESSGDDCYDILTADVRKLGTMGLYKHRLDSACEATQDYSRYLWSKRDPISPIPKKSLEYLLNPKKTASYKAYTEWYEWYERKYGKKCNKMLWKTIVDLKKRRDPHSDRWKKGIPVFLCGGGSVMDFYKDFASDMSSKVAAFYSMNNRNCGLKIYSLQKPEGLVMEGNQANYHRLAVAWGLSYPAYDIGEITRPDETGDVLPVKEIEKPDIPWER